MTDVPLSDELVAQILRLVEALGVLEQPHDSSGGFIEFLAHEGDLPVERKARALLRDRAGFPVEDGEADFRLLKGGVNVLVIFFLLFCQRALPCPIWDLKLAGEAAMALFHKEMSSCQSVLRA